MIWTFMTSSMADLALSSQEASFLGNCRAKGVAKGVQRSAGHQVCKIVELSIQLRGIWCSRNFRDAAFCPGQMLKTRVKELPLSLIWQNVEKGGNIWSNILVFQAFDRKGRRESQGLNSCIGRGPRAGWVKVDQNKQSMKARFMPYFFFPAWWWPPHVIKYENCHYDIRCKSWFCWGQTHQEAAENVINISNYVSIPK